MVYVVLRARTLDDLLHTVKCEFLGPFATWKQAHEHFGLAPYTDCSEGRDGFFYSIEEVQPCAC